MSCVDEIEDFASQAIRPGGHDRERADDKDSENKEAEPHRKLAALARRYDPRSMSTASFERRRGGLTAPVVTTAMVEGAVSG